MWFRSLRTSHQTFLPCIREHHRDKDVTGKNVYIFGRLIRSSQSLETTDQCGTAFQWYTLTITMFQMQIKKWASGICGHECPWCWTHSPHLMLGVESFKQNLNEIMKEASCFLLFLAAGRREAGEENWRRVCLQSEGRTRWEGGNLDCRREKRKRFCQHWLR